VDGSGLGLCDVEGSGIITERRKETLKMAVVRTFHLQKLLKEFQLNLILRVCIKVTRIFVLIRVDTV